MDVTITSTAVVPQDSDIVAIAVMFGKRPEFMKPYQHNCWAFVIDAGASKVAAKFQMPFLFEGCMAFTPSPQPLVLTASYYEWGVCAFDLKGELVWQRKDLKKGGKLYPIPRHAEKPRIAAEFEKTATRFLNLADGREAAFPIRGASEIVCSPDGKHGACLAQKKLVVFSFETKTALFNRPGPKHLDSGGFSPTSILVSWREWNGVAKGGHVQCLDFSGETLWELELKDEWLDELYWCGEMSKWLGVLNGYQRFGGDELVAMDPKTGDMDRRPFPKTFDLKGIYPCNGDNRFLVNGRLVLDQGCRILSVPSLDLVFDLVPILEKEYEQLRT